MNETLLAAFIGGLLASFPTLIITATNIREERRRRLVDAAIQCASVEWKEAKDMAIIMSSRGHTVQLAPFSTYYIGALMTLQSIDGTEDEAELKKKIRHVRKLQSDIVSTFKE